MAETFTGVPGKYVPLKETVRGFKAIIDGEMDEYPENAFFNVGTIEDVIAKARQKEWLSMSTFSLKIISTDKVFYDGKCEYLVIPTIDGEKGILAHHENMVIAVEIGELRFRKPDGEWVTAVVSKGFAEIVNNRASVLVNTAERPEDIDVKRAEEAKERAEEQLRQKQSIQEYYLSQASMARAMTRLKASRNRRGDI